MFKSILLDFSTRLIAGIRSYFRLKSYLKRNIKIASGTFIGDGVIIGRCTRINNPSYITRCKIGSFCAIGGRLVVRSTNHRTNYLNMQDWTQINIIQSTIKIAGISKGNVSIGNAVWIGDSVIILPGVTIGNGAVIGAGSVVTKPVPDYAIAAGNPAKIKGYRFQPEVIDLLSEVKWWEWDDNKIKRNKSLFEMDLESNSVENIRDAISNVE